MFIIFSFFILVVSIVLFKKACGFLTLTHFNLGMFVFYNLLFIMFFGSIEILYGWDPPGYLPAFKASEDLRLFGWFVIMYTMLALPTGMVLASNFFKIDSMKKLTQRYIQSEPVISDRPLFKKVMIVFSALSAFVALYTIFSQGEKIPLLALFSGEENYSLLLKLRRESGFKSENFIIQNILILFSGVLPVFFYTSFFYWKKFSTRTNYLWFFSLFIVAVFNSIYHMVKGPVVFLLLGLVFANFLISRKMPNWYWGITVILFFFILMGVLTVFFQGVTVNAWGILPFLLVGIGAFFHRIIFGQIVCSYLAFQYFPNLHPYLWFSSTGRGIHEFFGLPFSEDYGLTVMGLFRPEQVAAGTAGHATTVFIGEAWANFGLFGVIIAPIWVGFAIQILNILFLKLEKNPFNMAIYVYTAFLLPIDSSFIGFYYPAWLIQYLLVIALVYFVYYYLKGKIKFSIKKDDGFARADS
ncbi:MAG: oligosaccharide repeat unit polymerase [Candidatus Riflebacteria bacterium]|nr:oligosaccharide repeat unit polymerase [Candidatus Riflebacteria bacterium]